MPSVDRVIVGASGSPGSLRALRYAEVVARGHDAVLVPVVAWAPPEGDRVPRLHSGYLGQAWQDMACQALRGALIAVWGEVPDDPRVQPHVERGAAGWVLVSIACRPGDLLVVGAGRRGALAQAVSCRQAWLAGKGVLAPNADPCSGPSGPGQARRLAVASASAATRLPAFRCCLGLVPGSGCWCWRSPVLSYGAV